MSGNSHNWLIEVLLSPIGGFFTLWVLFKAVEVVWIMFMPAERRNVSGASGLIQNQQLTCFQRGRGEQVPLSAPQKPFLPDLPAEKIRLAGPKDGA